MLFRSMVGVASTSSVYAHLKILEDKGYIARKMDASREKKKTIECIEYLSVSAPLDKVDHLEDKQSKYIHEYVKNKEYMIVGTERRHGFSQNDVDRQWHQIVDKIRKKQVDGVIVANMSVITDNLIDAFIKVAQVQAAGGIIVTVDDGRLAMQLRGF